MIDHALEFLNEEQKKAVQHMTGVPAMVIAGAGSGKTRVLTTRVAYLISEHQVHPSSILLVTFTNKAALEMTRRVEKLTGSGLPFSGTFHRICARILRTSGQLVGVSPQFAIYDEDDQLSLMTEIMKELGMSPKEFKPRVMLSMISSAKNELITPSEYHNVARGRFQEAAARLYPLYQRRLEKNDALDFDDLLLKVVQLLSEHEEMRRFYQERFRHILIDEYQDTNTAQLALTKLLLGPERNLFVVGDFAQAIYSWRGADYRNMLSLTTQFPDMMTYRLEQNYRSTQSILDAASLLIAQNSSHPVLELWTDNGAGDKVSVFEGASDTDEVAHVVNSTRKFLANEENGSVAVLYRTNAQSRAFEEGFLKAGIPYRLVGGVRFYARKEIKDLLAYLRLCLKSDDEVALARILKLGKRKAQIFLSWLEREKSEVRGQRQVEREKEVETERQEAIEHRAQDVEQTEGLATKDKDQEQDSKKEELMESVLLTLNSEPLTLPVPRSLGVVGNPDPSQNALTVLDRILEVTQFLKDFDEHDEEDQGRLENIQELRSVAARFSDVPSFLETVALVEEDALRKEKFAEDTHVSLMSIHAAKGLEFDAVFVVGMEEGLFPHSRSLLDRLQMEEERRLMYVAMTRARAALTLSYARRRLIYGRISGSVVSRFLAEIPGTVLNKQASGYFDTAVNRYGERRSNGFTPPPIPTKQKFVAFDDPSIDDFLEGNMDIDTFLAS